MTMSEPRSSGGGPSTGPASTWSQAGSPAKVTRSPDDSTAPQTNDGGGPGSATLSPSCVPDGSSSRTSRTSSGPVSSMSSRTLPGSGSMRGGTVSPRPPWVRRISAGASSSLLPTPSASSYGTNQGGSAGRTGPVRPSLDTMARHGLWPTPSASMADKGGRGDLHFLVTRGALSRRRDWDEAPTAALSGQLNPTWLEWLQGFPPGWTDGDP